MVTILNALFPDVFPPIASLPDSIGWLIVGLQMVIAILWTRTIIRMRKK